MEEYTQLTLDLGQYTQEKEEIKRDLGGIVKSFVRVGWHLWRISRSEAYKMDGYSTIAEFAKAEYGMTPSGVTRFIEVYERYSDEGDSPELKEQYRDFKFAQLTEMLQISEEDQQMFQPETKRETIRDFKSFQKENENSPDRLLNWMKEPEDLIGRAILEMFKSKKDVLNELYGSEAYDVHDVKKMSEIVNPSGNGHFRHGTIFLIMYDYQKGIMVSEFGTSPKEMTWDEFFRRTDEIFAEAAAGDKTWEACFGTEEDQIPGQDTILNHPEVMPEAEGAGQAAGQQAEQPHEPVPEEIGPERPIAPAQTSPKTEEQKYNAEQNRIDRETKAKLQEKEDEEKMQHLPSDDGPTVHQIRLTSSYYDDVLEGRKTFELRKNDRGYGVGHILELMEFAEGRNTGRVIRAEIVYMLEDYTGLEDGYCILGIRVIE